MDSLFNFEFYPTYLSMFPPETMNRAERRQAEKISRRKPKKDYKHKAFKLSK